MKKFVLSLFVLALIGGAAMAQTSSSTTSSRGIISPAGPTPGPPAITANSTPQELARAAQAAMGGDKFKNMKSMMLLGTVDLYPPNSAQSIPGKFAMVTDLDRFRLEIDARPIISFKQIYDGQRSYSSIPNVQLPPASKFGLSVLAKFDQPGYTVSALPDKKKLRGFRIVDAEGNTTDFYIDAASGQLKTYLIPYNGYVVGTDITKTKQIDGVLVPFNFTQRMEMPQGAFFAEYKVKEAKLNQPVADDLFTIQ